jgi:hypothetical protein
VKGHPVPPSPVKKTKNKKTAGKKQRNKKTGVKKAGSKKNHENTVKTHASISATSTLSGYSPLHRKLFSPFHPYCCSSAALPLTDMQRHILQGTRYPTHTHPVAYKPSELSTTRQPTFRPRSRWPILGQQNHLRKRRIRGQEAPWIGCRIALYRRQR